MESDPLDLDIIVMQNRERCLESVLEKVAHHEEITVAVHAAFDLTDSKMPETAKQQYISSTGEFLRYSSQRGFPIIHFRDTVSVFGEAKEPSLEERFEIKPDFEVITMPNMGVPIDLAGQWLEQFIRYGIFAPSIYIPGNKIKTINGIGTFAEPDACLVDGVAVMSSIASEVRIIKECVLPKKTEPFDIGGFRERYGMSEDIVKLYSFKDGAVLRTN